ncbi:hypothetical protein GCM10020000_49700 [Streptomyces olivoverticillatus]
MATRADLADYHRLKGEQVDTVLEGTGLVPVEVEGWSKPAWAAPEALAAEPRGRHRTTLLSPFDSLIWDRPRTERIFGFTHRLEAYVPKAKRIHGYFVMPLLSGDGSSAGSIRRGREDAGGPAGVAGRAESGGTHGAGAVGGGGVGGLRRRARGALRRREAGGGSRRRLGLSGSPGRTGGRGRGQRISRIFSLIA